MIRQGVASHACQIIEVSVENPSMIIRISIENPRVDSKPGKPGNNRECEIQPGNNRKFF